MRGILVATAIIVGHLLSEGSPAFFAGGPESSHARADKKACGDSCLTAAWLQNIAVRTLGEYSGLTIGRMPNASLPIGRISMH